MTKSLKEIPKTTKGLRIALFDEINGLRTGTSNISRATAIHKLATQIIELTKVEINYESQIKNIKQLGS